MKVLAIDPGPAKSAIVLYESETRVVLHHEIQDNASLLGTYERYWWRDNEVECCAIEMIASYGMAVGAEVFSTCVWVGRFTERAELCDMAVYQVFRRDVKLHLCGQARAKDANVRQALIDRFGPGKDKAIGKKKAQGPLFGIKADEWAALAVAVTFAETIVEKRREARKEKAA